MYNVLNRFFYGNHKNGCFFGDLFAPSAFSLFPPPLQYGYLSYLFSSFLLCNSTIFHLGCHFLGEGLLLSIPLPFTVINDSKEGFDRFKLELAVYRVVSSHLAPFTTLARLCCTYNISVLCLERIQWQMTGMYSELLLSLLLCTCLQTLGSRNSKRNFALLSLHAHIARKCNLCSILTNPIILVVL